MASTTEPPKLSTLFASVPPEPTAQAGIWSSCYRDDFHPWDRAGPSLALVDLIDQRPDLIPPALEFDARNRLARDSSGAAIRRTALVPGCGLGHDALMLSARGYDVWALDVSPEAIEQARANEKTASSDAAYTLPASFEKGNITWVTGDFFADEWATGAGTEGSGKFDLIFDYTFLCALPLELRPRWAERITSLLHPKGRLVCLEFPSGKALSEAGPPWGVNPEVYEALLGAPGEPIQYSSSGDGAVVSVPSPKPRDDAVHRLSLIKPRRTHPAGVGEDGSVRDFISIWSR